MKEIDGEKRAADRYEDAAALVAALDSVGQSTFPRQAPMSRRTLVLAGVGSGSRRWVGGIATLDRRPRATPSHHRLTFRRGMIRTARFGPDVQTVLYGTLWEG